MTRPTPPPAIDVSAEAKQSLLDHLTRDGTAKYIRVHVGHG